MTATRSTAGRRRRPTPLNLLTAAARGGGERERVRGTAAARLASALGATARDEALLPAYRAEFLKLPTESDVARELAREVDTDAVHQARETLRATIGREIRETLAELYEQTAPTGPYSPDPESAGLRALRSAALDLLVATGEASEIARAERHYREAANMTDAIAALSILSQVEGPARDAGARSFLCALAGRASCPRQMVRGAGAGRAGPNSVETVRALLSHPKFSLKNPNRIRALIGSFAHANPTGFNRADGAGYRLLADQALEIDRFNPHVAARLLGAFESWRILEPGRQARAKAVLEDLAAKSLSTDSYEIVTKTLGRGLESRLCQRVINRISTALLWTADALIDSNGDVGDSEMRQLLRLDAGERLRGTEWRGRVRRVRDSLSRDRTGRTSAPSSAAIFPTPSGFAASCRSCWRPLPPSPLSASPSN